MLSLTIHKGGKTFKCLNNLLRCVSKHIFIAFLVIVIFTIMSFLNLMSFHDVVIWPLSITIVASQW